MAWTWVLIFGVVGVASRFAIDSWVQRWSFSFPCGTLFINIAGCLVAGLVLGFGPQKNLTEEPLRLGVIVGFCGGFTTMSGFGLQVVQLMNSGKLTQAIAYGIGSPIICVLSVATGLFVARMFG